MGMIKKCGKESLHIKHVFNYLKYKIEFAKEHPNYFDADGLLCFVGPQGSGKSLSAVNYVCNLMKLYPMCKLVTNLEIDEYPIVTYEEFIRKNHEYYELLQESNLSEEEKIKTGFSYYVKNNRIFPFENNDDLSNYDNDEFGIIYLIDEITLYLNSLESKNVNMDTMTEISQQRKQRKHIVTTSQVFGRMAKPLREQFSNVILCKNYLGFLQYNRLIDRDSIDTESSTDTNITGEVKQKFLWFHDPKMYKRYDTYKKIQRGKFVSGEKQKGGIYQYDIGLSTSN